MPQDLQTRPPESTAVVLSSEFQAEMMGRVKEQLAEEEFDLPRIQIVHKVQQFQLPDGETIVKSFRAIYLGFHRFNIYWEKQAVEGETLPPTCVSQDCVMGNADRLTQAIGGVNREVYGECRTCWLNEFKSDPKGGKGKACNNKGMLLLWPIDLGLTLPCLLTVSSTGLWVPKEITSQAVAKNIAAEWMICKFELDKAGEGQNVYSTIKVTQDGDILNGRVSEAQCREATRIRAQFLSRVKTVKVAEPESDTAGYVVDPPIRGVASAPSTEPQPGNDGLPF